ncbi:hypothetical protein Acr_13g0017230 [Actinidia rufa]|uniref:Uncharacterized protein n=1 Tax=Actinidia rufa TaxID=165716 RepID=A0A7J0FP12_9ERIC|nr:hypothetical protein Acr_13g0017230 [Actinidia rufa]
MASLKAEKPVGSQPKKEPSKGPASTNQAPKKPDQKTQEPRKRIRVVAVAIVQFQGCGNEIAWRQQWFLPESSNGCEIPWSRRRPATAARVWLCDYDSDLDCDSGQGFWFSADVAIIWC